MTDLLVEKGRAQNWTEGRRGEGARRQGQQETRKTRRLHGDLPFQQQGEEHRNVPFLVLRCAINRASPSQMTRMK
ncbi:hypothetical protein M378DRAFT_160426 [Amanita muscaria Koide BX008]|uniref:Uncharacterized protein n=1 Tax=Amanita muscaria (strain Koide BX008) TaxID=946122 RepID=A0A0C2XBZ8_AMAMK|nr:hypothetical protein M378DRAFT_160426 [Amanita muscaria Koide BX008]